MISKVRIAIVVGMSTNRVIGKDGGLPWHIRSDLKKFKEITAGKPLIMGATTWDSLPRKPLPGRLNLVLTRDPRFEADGAIVCNSIFEAVDIAREHAVDDDIDEICVIGGANIYEQFLPKSDRLYVSEIQADVEGDAIFPEIDTMTWELASSEPYVKAEGDDYDFTLKIYNRRK